MTDFIDAAEPEPLESVVASVRLDHLRHALDQLPSREREVLVKRYGLGGRDHHTLEALAETMGCRKEWVRQLQRRAEDLLRQYFLKTGIAHHA